MGVEPPKLGQFVDVSRLGGVDPPQRRPVYDTYLKDYFGPWRGVACPAGAGRGKFSRPPQNPWHGVPPAQSSVCNSLWQDLFPVQMPTPMGEACLGIGVNASRKRIPYFLKISAGSVWRPCTIASQTFFGCRCGYIPLTPLETADGDRSLRVCERGVDPPPA